MKSPPASVNCLTAAVLMFCTGDSRFWIISTTAYRRYLQCIAAKPWLQRHGAHFGHTTPPAEQMRANVLAKRDMSFSCGRKALSAACCHTGRAVAATASNSSSMMRLGPLQKWRCAEGSRHGTSMQTVGEFTTEQLSRGLLVTWAPSLLSRDRLCGGVASLRRPPAVSALPSI